MPTKQKTKSKQEQKISFDPKSKSTYDQLIFRFQNYIEEQLGERGMDNQLTRLLIGQGEKAIGGSFATAASAAARNMQALGLVGAPGQAVLGSNLGRLQRAKAGASSQNIIQNLIAGEGRRSVAAGMAGSFQPLQTGQTQTGESTTSTSGLGTWLPQLLGGIAGIATMGMTGGMSAAAGMGGQRSGASALGNLSGPGAAGPWNSWLTPGISQVPPPNFFGGGQGPQ